jgi:FK506-binding protein 2
MRFGAFIPAVLALCASVVVADADVPTIEVLYMPEKCERKTQKGDNIEVHYEGRLASDNSVFDASHNRGKPLGFKVGSGQVIKGQVLTTDIVYQS